MKTEGKMNICVQWHDIRVKWKTELRNVLLVICHIQTVLFLSLSSFHDPNEEPDETVQTFKCLLQRKSFMVWRKSWKGQCACFACRSLGSIPSMVLKHSLETTQSTLPGVILEHHQVWPKLKKRKKGTERICTLTRRRKIRRKNALGKTSSATLKSRKGLLS